MENADQLVIIIDDDPPMRQALKRLIETVGLNGKTYASGQEFLQRPPLDVPSCLVLDIRLPGLSGLNLQRELSERGINTIIEPHLGRLWATPNEHKGATFRFTLPTSGESQS
jgi:FixJ family two-component response regulator